MKSYVKVFLRDKQGIEDSFETMINASPDQAYKYYIGKYWNMGREDDYMMKCYDVLIHSTPVDELGKLVSVETDGLYYIDSDGCKRKPNNIYFSGDLHRIEGEDKPTNGFAYTSILGGLTPIYLPNGERFRYSRLCNVSAWYVDNIIKGFRRA